MDKTLENLKPGRELDMVIAEKVMGWRRCRADEPPKRGWFTNKGYWLSNPGHHGPDEMEFPRFSTSIEAAWEIIEKHKMFEPEICYSDEFHGWRVHYWKGNPESNRGATAETAPHAICLAALRAVGHTIP